MRINVPMCGSTASYSCGGAANAEPDQASHAAAPSARRLLIVFNTTVPVAVHLIHAGYFDRAYKAETEPLGIGLIPDTLWQLRILLLPRRVGRHACG